VRVFELNEALGEVGAGLSLSPNANHALNYLGLESVLARIGSKPRSAGVQHYKTGELLVDATADLNPRARYGADYLMVHRADLHAALLAAVTAIAPDCIQTGHELIGLEHAGQRNRTIFANGFRVDSDIVIGCDGIHSRVRSAMHGQESPRFTGYIAWRGLVPLDNIDPALLKPESGICIAPGRTCTRYLIRPRRVVNYVAAARSSGWEIEDWSVRSEITELLEEFSDFHAGLRQILAATPAALCFKWALHDRDPLPHWTEGRVSLLGDAAHPMLPFLGQGAAMAIEDAVILQRALSQHDEAETALKVYEQARLARTTFVMLESRENIKRMQSPDPDNYDRAAHRNEAALGLFDYNPVTADI
jgi:salicylate hydroxylase